MLKGKDSVYVLSGSTIFDLMWRVSECSSTVVKFPLECGEAANDDYVLLHAYPASTTSLAEEIMS